MTTQASWYETFFDGLALELWRQAVTPEMTGAEAGFLARELLLTAGAEVLDVPSGNGRHAVELARRGFRMTGIDISADYVEEARRESAAAGVEVEWIHGDMRRIPAGRTFAGAYCFGNSFGYLGHEGNREYLAAVAAALVPGGSFALDTGLAAESILPTMQKKREMEVGDMLMRIENFYHPETGDLQTDYVFIRNGEEERKSSWHQVYTVAELGRMMGAVGLDFTAAYSGTGSEPFQLGSQRLILIARKRA